MSKTVTMNTSGELVFPDSPIMNRQLMFLKKFWVAFHNSIIIALLFTVFGIAVGVKVCRDFYDTKMNDVIQTGAMLHKAKVYTISPKL